MTFDHVPTEAERAAMARRVQRHLHHHWKSYTFQGALMAIVGVLALLAPFAATLASTLFFGWLLIIGGVLGAVTAFRANGAPGFWSTILLAVLAIALGAIFIANPIAGSVTLTWALAAYFVLSGMFNFSIAQAVRASTGRFWLLVLSGIVDVALAVFLIFGLPATAVWAVGIFLGVSLITSGMALVFSALDARNNPPAAGG